MPSPSMERYSLPCGRLPSLLYPFLIFLWIFCLQTDTVYSQPMQIRKTIKEELLPGEVIVRLASEPDFKKILENNGIITKDSPEPKSQLQYSILTSANPHSEYFAVDKDTGVVTIKRNIDREKVCSFRDECHLNFEVAARSEYGVFFVLIDFTIEITDTNDNPPEFTQHRFELFVPEDSDSGSSFQLPTAFDRDTGPGNGVKSYSMIKAASLFDLEMRETGFNTSDVFLLLKSSLNRESASTYKILIGAVDGGIPPLTGTLTVEVHVSDINDNFPVFEKPLYLVTIPEDTRNDQVIQQVTATDDDAGPNGQLTYRFSAQQPLDDLEYFRIEPQNGKIFLAKSIESRTGEDIDLVVEAGDQGHPPKVSRARVRVRVEDTINSMPEIIIDTLGGAGGMAEVSEYGETGKVVAYVSVRDPDSGDNGRTECYLSSPEFELEKLNDKGKYKAVLKADLDRELTDMYNVTVSCSDSGFPSLLAREGLTVKVLDENDQRPTFSQRTYEASIYENKTAGSLITQLTVTDGDIGKNAEISYEVVGINNQYFTVDDDGRMMAKVPLDREYSDRMVTTIIARDKGDPPLSTSATVVVNLLDINDMQPEFSEKVYNFEVEEEQAAGKYVGIVSASDKDLGANGNLFYHFPLSYTQGQNFFLVGVEGGVIKTNVVLDREIRDHHDFIVLATDRGSPALTGTARVIIKVTDVNDNDPFFLFPTKENNTISIPHTFEPQNIIVSAIAHDTDDGLNARIVYSVSSMNASAPFAMNPDSGALYIEEKFTKEDIGLYTLTLMANDQGFKQQRATQAPLYIDVYFDNSTLLMGAGTAGPSTEVTAILIVLAAILIIVVIIGIAFFCIRKRRMKKAANGGVPNSASSSSTTKLQGGYYIAPGVRGSSSSFIAKPEDGLINNSDINNDMGDGIRTGNNYVVLLSNQDNEPPPAEVIEISRNGHHNGMNDTLNTADLDQTDDGQFSTFKSQEDILSPGLRQGSLQRQSTNSIAKRANDTFDDLSCDDSTSDSGRGGSDVDANNAAAAANKEKARAQAATPISMKSGISHRLSPLPHEKNTFITFRGDSPSSFKFDSDNDTLTRQMSRNSPRPLMSSPTQRDAPRFEPERGLRLSESDTDNDLTPRNRHHPQPLNVAGIHGPHIGGSGYSSGGENGPYRQPLRVAPLPMFMPSSTYHRRDSETEQSDGSSSNRSNSLSRRNHVPRLPYYPGIEFSHHAYGGSNRNSVGAFSNHSVASNSDGYYPDYDRSGAFSANRQSANDYNHPVNDGGNNGVSYYDYNNPTTFVPDSRVSNNYGNVVSELQESRPVSMEGDFLLPPYPEVDDEDERDLAMHSGYTGMTPERDGERATLFSRSRFESSA